jgi:predicted dehydrogenase
MSKTYRLGVIGFAHMHINALIDAFHRLPNVTWVACADTVPSQPSISTKSSTRRANLRRAHQEIGIPLVYDDYHEMLSREAFDIVIFCPENARHAEVAEAIAASGAHMVTEKPMAHTLSDALRMARAARTYDVELMINWPSTWNPANRMMKQLIDADTVGDVWEIKWRNGASMGPLAYGTGADAVTDEEKAAEWWHREADGGGALLDYCCYGACLARWYLGEPATAALGLRANMTSHYGDADDNAIITVRFPRAMAILEATWTTWNPGVPTGPIAYGTRGTLVVNAATQPDGSTVQAVEVYTTRRHGLGTPDEVVPGDPLPEGRATLAEEFVHHLETGEPLHPTLQMEHNLETMAILDAGIRSARSGRIELVDNDVWRIG